jgi:hypothetical protein
MEALPQELTIARKALSNSCCFYATQPSYVWLLLKERLIHHMAGSFST